MIDLKIDPLTDDLVLDGDDLALVEDVPGSPAATVQGVRIRLRFVQGEWFLNEEEGIPYFTEILIKRPNLVAVREWFRLTIADSPGIDSVESVQLTYSTDRRLTVTYRANAGSVESQEQVP